MTAAERLTRAAEAIDQGLQELEAALPEVEPYAVEPLRFLRAELLVAKRRLENVSKVLRGARGGRAEAGR